MIEAESRRHATLDPGHVLLGVVEPTDAPAAVALARAGVAPDALRTAIVRRLDAELEPSVAAFEVSPATDDLLLRAYQHSVERESPTVSDVDILVASVLDAGSTAGQALQDVGLTPARLLAVTAERRALVAQEDPAGVAAPRAEGGAGRARVSAPNNIMFGGTPSLPGASRSGIGYDSHRFEPGGPLVLGGVRIESDVRLVGHSDGDAVAHAITDAVLGAAAAGDIGELFSDQDPANRGRDSVEMLGLAVGRLRERGFVVQQVDVTVVAERPRIGPHRAAMSERLAGALGVLPEAVSVKGKTNEGMGWIGRGEGLACIAVATVVPAPADD